MTAADISEITINGASTPFRTLGDSGLTSNGRAIPMLDITPRAAPAAKDKAGKWLRNAMIALGILALAAAVVSFAAQFALVLAVKQSVIIAAIQAGIPDVGSLVFASLGIAMALQGKRALRARALNLVCVGISIGMNALAAPLGWTAFVVFVMAPVLYALASDTLIGVIRAYTIARQRAMDETLADEGTTPMAVVGGFLLWVLRLVLAPPSTLMGFRAWVVAEVKVAPGTRAVKPVAVVPGVVSVPSAAVPPRDVPARKAVARKPAARKGRGGTKTAEFLALVTDQYGPLETFPIEKVSKVSTELAPKVGLHPGSARSVLKTRVLAAQEGIPS